VQESTGEVVYRDAHHTLTQLFDRINGLALGLEKWDER